MPSSFPLVIPKAALLSFAFAIQCSALAFAEVRPVDAEDQRAVGVQPNGGILVPTNQVLTPAGQQVTFPGRPVDLTLSADGKTLVAKNMGDLVLIDVANAKVQTVLRAGRKAAAKVSAEDLDNAKIASGYSVTGLVSTPTAIFVTDAKNALWTAHWPSKAGDAFGKPITLPAPAVGGAPHPAGICLAGDGQLWVTATRSNSVYLVAPQTGGIEASVFSGVAPFSVCAPLPHKIYVSNWGGDPPAAGEPQLSTSGTPARIDPRTSVVNDGTVAVITKLEGAWKKTLSLKVGLHPSVLIASRGGKRVYVANASSDTVSVINTESDTVVETISCRPGQALPFGSGSDALALSPDGSTLYVANATNNCLAVITLGKQARDSAVPEAPAASEVRGLIPTGWYPAAVAVSPDGKRLFVANLKGHGLLANLRAKEKGHSSGDYLGSVSIIDVPDEKQFTAYTQQVRENNRLAYSKAGLEAPRPGVSPAPVPERHGESSVFQHVVYIIRENKTYDQVLGDLEIGEGDKELCIFPEKITPNAHALSREFTLFDNFYCSGSKSPDGHAWTDESYVTDYLERAYGGFTRSYPYEGSDTLSFAPSGFLWDNALAHGKTFRNYGEFCRTTYLPKGQTWETLFRDFQTKAGQVTVQVEPNIPSLKPYTHPSWPGFPLLTPDVRRAQLFKQELAAFEQKGEMPNLLCVFLPQDHTSGTTPGTPTPRAMVADNDQALGEIVEAITRSRFWKDTCIFVVEDDPQSGYDHVDGHRTVALVISPYTKRHFVDHTNYNQTGMFKTIELTLGLPPLNQLDLCATAMRHCFQPNSDLATYSARPAQIPLDEMNPPLKKLKGTALHWARKSLELSFEKEDEADDETLNHILWFAQRGSAPYPQAYAGKDDD